MDTKGLPDSVNVLKRILFEGFATGDTGIVDEVFSPDVVEHQFGLEGRGQEALAQVKEAIRQVHEAMPDLRYDLDDWATRGDTAWVRFTGRGTNTGPFFGPPSGLAAEVSELGSDLALWAVARFPNPNSRLSLAALLLHDSCDAQRLPARRIW